MWRGNVAASFDLVGALRSGFNGELSSKLLAIVDEIREGARADAWEHSETLKKLITEERRTVNFKYGAQTVEFNSCRFLLFSNSPAAIPLGSSDRRFEVSIFEGDPKPEAYYARLYGLLDHGGFANDIAFFLGQRDIAAFNPGGRARLSKGKERIIEATQSEGSVYAGAVAEHWPSAIISNATLSLLIDPRADGAMTPVVRATAAEAGMQPGAKPVWTSAGNIRFQIIRNHDRWRGESGSAIAAEMRRGVPQKLGLNRDWRDWLDGIAGGREGFG